MGKGTAVFLDTTILIASVIHGPKIKESIKRRLEKFSFVCSGLVARHEFKQRLLKDAKYLHKLSQEYDSIQEVNRRISCLPPLQRRKHSTCTEIVDTVDEMEDDKDRLDRLRMFTLYLLRHSLRKLDRLYHFFPDSGCACGKGQIVERKRRFDLGPDKCSKTGSACRIDDFLRSRESTLSKIREYLGKIPSGRKPGQKSEELVRVECFIAACLSDSSSVQSKEPCTRVGDLLLALESESIPNFYTINSRESQHLCKVLKQTLIVRPRNPAKDEVVCSSAEPTWPQF